MKQYLLDTNVCIAILKNNLEVFKKVLNAGQENCHISEITVAELFYGAAKAEREEQYKDISKMIGLFDVIPMYPGLKLYGQIKWQLEKQGNRLDDFDLLIGATAIHNNLIMVTANIKHLARIPNIKVENWEETAK